MGYMITSIIGWIWSNFIGIPRSKNHFTGLIRMCFYIYVLKLDDHSYLPFTDVFDYFPIYYIFIFAQFIIGLTQFIGLYSINGPFDFRLNEILADAKYSDSIRRVSTSQEEKPFDKEYPGLTWWFRVRENEMSGMTPSQKASFFIETGGLTEGSVKEMSKYQNTKRALQRLDYECQRPHKELVNYMRGIKIK